ncbi:MAG: HAD hydrolase-like protein [Verrucomicrobia bacterium]|nr:HAD hydrolase-like protein [Verrucomicrobiota bacterium]
MVGKYRALFSKVWKKLQAATQMGSSLWTGGGQTGSLPRMKETYSKDDLTRFPPRHDVLTAIDSDGCVFDSMTIKQRIFHTELIKLWGLDAVEAEVRQVAEWVSLYSPWRGLNRFQLLLQIFQTLEKAKDFFPTLGKTPETKSLEAFVESGVALSNDELKKWNDPELQKVLDWSLEVSRQIAAIPEMPVFDGVFQCLEKIRECADAIVVSQTTEEALVREWRNAELERFVDVIAGAELGSKIESLGTAMNNRYTPEKTLMVGDAPGDLETARATGGLFFPIIPGDEVASWIELREEGLDRLLKGTFAGTYQEYLIVRFNAALSPIPPWA